MFNVQLAVYDYLTDVLYVLDDRIRRNADLGDDLESALAEDAAEALRNHSPQEAVQMIAFIHEDNERFMSLCKKAVLKKSQASDEQVLASAVLQGLDIASDELADMDTE